MVTSMDPLVAGQRGGLVEAVKGCVMSLGGFSRARNWPNAVGLRHFGSQLYTARGGLQNRNRIEVVQK